MVIEPFQGFRDLICTIPSIGTLTADVIIAEAGADMSRFPTPGVLGRHVPGQQRVRRPGHVDQDQTSNPYLKGALGAAAMNCAQNPSTYLGARYRRIASRRGPMKANVAIQHKMLTIIWHMATTGTLYDDPEPTTSAGSTPNAPRTEPSTNSKRWATKSLSTALGNENTPCHERESSHQ